jgi:hypothetical protein
MKSNPKINVKCFANVKGSTIAIPSGKYKQVNMIGASCIAAAMSAIGDR